MQQLNSRKKISKAIAIGGGIGGLTFARACLDAGIEVELYEKRPLESMLSGAGGIFIQRNAMRVYQLIWEGQIYQQLYNRGGKILAGGFFSQSGEPLYINTPEFAGEPDLGVCILRSDLQQILYSALPPSAVKTGVALEDFEQTEIGVQVKFTDGSTATGDILVGADGLYSKTRSRLQGQDRLEPAAYSGTCCWRGYFPAASVSLPSQYSWQEFWGQGNRFGYFDVGGGQCAFYGFQNCPPNSDDQKFGGALPAMRSLFASYAEPVPSIIAALSTAQIYRDDICDRLPPGNQWGNGRATLLGDAAHPVQPTLGQGGCMAIEDAFELAKLLRHQDNFATAEDLLRHYERHRRDRVTRVFQISRQIAQLAQLESPLACFGRNWLYKLTPTWLGDWQFRWLFDYRPSWE